VPSEAAWIARMRSVSTASSSARRKDGRVRQAQKRLGETFSTRHSLRTRKVRLARIHEFKEDAFLPANQAVAFARMSRSICTCRT